MDPITGMAIGSGVVSAANSIFDIGNSRDKQLEQQQKLTDIQKNANAELMAKSYEQQRNMYDYTFSKNTPAAQVARLKEAGLNPALMYGIGGQGGATAGGGGAAVSGSQASSATDWEANRIAQQGMGLQLAKLRSEIDVNKSVANANNADAEKKSGVDTEMGHTTIQKLIAETANEKVKNELLDIEKSIQQRNYGVLGEQLEMLARSNEIGEETKKDMIMTIRQQAIGSMLENSAKRAGIELTMQQANAVSESIQQKWEEIKVQWKNADTNEKNAMIKEAEVRFEQSTPGVGDIAGAVLKELLTRLNRGEDDLINKNLK